MKHECEFCADLDKYNLESAKPVTFSLHHTSKEYDKLTTQKQVTRLMHKERNGVHFCTGVECRNQNENETP